MDLRYSIRIEQLGYTYDNDFIAYFPAFGQCACSFVDESPGKAVEGLLESQEFLIEHYNEIGKELPSKDF